MVRHVLECEHLYHKIIQNKGSLGDYVSPWKTLAYKGIDEEIEFAKPFREAFLSYVANISATDLKNFWIQRKEVNQKRRLGDYLLRVAYHESVHTGQMLGYLRSSRMERPLIWD